MLLKHLIIGLPEETTEEILDTLAQLNAYDIDNLTIHCLAFKRASKLFKESQERNSIDRALIKNMVAHL